MKAKAEIPVGEQALQVAGTAKPIARHKAHRDELDGLAAQLRAGMAAAWDKLYRITHLPLLRALRRRLGDESAAEEALQATYVTAVEKIAVFDPARGTVDAWLAGIARNKAREMLKKRPAVPLGEDPRAAAEPNDDAERVARALDALAPRHAEVLRRKYLTGESIQTIAAALNLKEATVGTWLHRARESFRQTWRRMGD